MLGEPEIGPNVVREPFVRRRPTRSNGGVSGSWRGSCTYLQQIRKLNSKKHVKSLCSGTGECLRQILRIPGSDAFLGPIRQMHVEKET
jgi:hypothetical protein